MTTSATLASAIANNEALFATMANLAATRGIRDQQLAAANGLAIVAKSLSEDAARQRADLAQIAKELSGSGIASQMAEIQKNFRTLGVGLSEVVKANPEVFGNTRRRPPDSSNGETTT